MVTVWLTFNITLAVHQTLLGKKLGFETLIAGL